MPIIACLLLLGAALALDLFVDQGNERNLQLMKTGMLAAFVVIISVLVGLAVTM